MPPALSDIVDTDDSDGPDSVPARVSQKTAARKPLKAGEGDDTDNEAEKPNVTDNGDNKEKADDDDDDDESGEDEYTVEKILKHGFDDDGRTIYLIKWLGYDQASDRTWEPREHLDSAKELLDAYHDSIGGEPRYTPPPASKGGKGRKRASTAADDSSLSSKKQRGRKSNGIESVDGKAGNKIAKDLPLGTWESDVIRVTSLENVLLPGKNGKEEEALFGSVEWKGPVVRKSKHPLCTLRQKCPQALLDYYELHLKFTVVTDPDRFPPSKKETADEGSEE